MILNSTVLFIINWMVFFDRLIIYGDRELQYINNKYGQCILAGYVQIVIYF